MGGPPRATILSLTHSTLHAHDLSNAASISIPASDVPTTAVAVDDTQLRIVEGLQNGDVLIRDAASFSLTDTIHASPSTAAVSALAFSVASTHLAVGFTDGAIVIRDMRRPHIVSANLPTQPLPILSLSFHPSATPRYLAVQTAHAIAIISTSNFRQLARLAPPPMPSRSYTRTPSAAAKMTACAFSPLHTSLLAVSDDTGCISVWDVSKHFVARSKTSPDLSDSSVHSRFTPPLRAPAAAIAFTSDAALAVGGFDKQLRFYDSDLTRFLFSAVAPAPISALAFRSGRAVAGLTDGSFALIDFSISDKFAAFTTRVNLPVPPSAPSVAVRAIFLPSPITPKNNRDVSSDKPSKKSGAIDHVTNPLGSSSVSQNTSQGSRGYLNRVANLPTVAFETTLNLESIDELLSGRAQGDSFKAPQDADLFSPVSKRSPPARRIPPLLDDGGPSLNPEAKPSVERRSQIVQDFLKNENNFNLDTTTDEFSTPARAGGGRPAFKEEFRETTLFSNSIADEFGLGGVDEYVIQGQRKNTPPRPIEGSPNSGQSSGTSNHFQRVFPGRPASVEISKQPSYGQNRHGLLGPDATLGHSPQSSENSRNSRQAFTTGVLSGTTVRETGDVQPESEAASNEEMSVGRVMEVGRQLDLRRDFSGSNGEAGNSKTVTAETVISELTTAVRETIKLELDERLTDLRNDILNIHSEMVVMESRRAAELNSVVLERDELVLQLRSEISKLREDNDRLRRNYGLG